MTEVRLTLTPKSATLVVMSGAAVLQSEEWKFDRPAPKRELRDLAECVFHDCYDLLNHTAHGPPE
jgi:hypothetical protein